MDFDRRVDPVGGVDARTAQRANSDLSQPGQVQGRVRDRVAIGRVPPRTPQTVGSFVAVIVAAVGFVAFAVVVIVAVDTGTVVVDGVGAVRCISVSAESLTSYYGNPGRCHSMRENCFGIPFQSFLMRDQTDLHPGWCNPQASTRPIIVNISYSSPPSIN